MLVLVEHHRDQDVCHLLALGGAQDASDSLDDVDRRSAGLDEHHGVQGRDVHALGETPRVGDDDALVAGRLAQALHRVVAQRLRHPTGDRQARDPARRAPRPQRVGEQREVGSEVVGRPHAVVERDDRPQVVAAHRVEQGRPGGDGGRVADRAADPQAIGALDEHAVIREQAARDRLAEGQLVEERPVRVVVVHVEDREAILLRAASGPRGEQPRRRGQKQTLACTDRARVEDQ